MPPIVKSLAGLRQLGEPQPIGQALLISSSMCTGAVWPLAQLLDQRDALLQLRLARLELLHLREHRAQLRGLGLGRWRCPRRAARDCWRSDQNHQPIEHGRGEQDQARARSSRAAPPG